MKKRAKPGTRAKPAKRPARRAKPPRPASRKTAKQPSAKRPARKPAKRAVRRRTRQPGAARWTKFVEQHGVVLASAKGPVPSVAEAIVGEPIVGSWWSHPKGQQIFDALSAIDDHEDIRCFKLVDHKITFVHRRLWPALAKLAQAGVLEADRVASIQQEHMPTGEHRNLTMPFPDWVPDAALARAEAMSIDDAKHALGGWL